MKYICKIIGLLLIVLSSVLGFAAIRLCISLPSVPAFVVAILLLPACAALVIAATEFMKCSSLGDIGKTIRNLLEMLRYFG